MGWITNALKSSDNSDLDCVVGEPMPTKDYTKQQLIDEGIVGLYTVDGHEVSRPVVNKKRGKKHGSSRKNERSRRASPKKS